MDEVTTQVAVVGAGPAGLAAAVAAAEAGARTLVLDDNPDVGGQIWRRDPRAERVPEAARLWRRAQRAGAKLLAGASVVAADGPGSLLIDGTGGCCEVRARAVVLASGARELLLPFPGWTLPGVTGAGGLQALVKGGLPISSRRVVVAGSGPLLVAVAALLVRRGARVVRIAEQAPRRAAASFFARALADPSRALHGLRLLASMWRVPVSFASWPVRAQGDERLEAVWLRTPAGERRIACDWLACGFGLVPQIELATLLGCDLEEDAVRVDAWQHSSNDRVWCAGEITGVAGVEAAVAEGFVAGRAAAGLPVPDAWRRRRDRAERLRRPLARAFRLRRELRELAATDTIVCRCEDVPYGALCGCTRAREAKLRTRCGMGVCQARVCGPATRFLFGWKHDRVRPPLLPAPVRVLAQAGIPGTRGDRSG